MSGLRKRLRRWQHRRRQPKWNRHPLWTDERGIAIFPAALADPGIYREWLQRRAEEHLAKVDPVPSGPDPQETP